MSEQPRTKLEVQGVSKHFTLPTGEPVIAVSDISFDVHENEFCVLLGPSGCGKSTVLRLIAGLEEPSSGSLMLEGNDILGTDHERGMVFQRATPRLTG